MTKPTDIRSTYRLWDLLGIAYFTTREIVWYCFLVKALIWSLS